MSATKILIAAAVAVILSTLACAKPRHIRSTDENKDNEIQEMTLDQVLMKTVCPIRVEYDELEGRVPRRIKQMKCARQTNQCSDKPDPRKCCSAGGNDYHLACVEILDRVLVFYKDNTNSTVNVSVGCSCFIQNAATTKKIPNH